MTLDESYRKINKTQPEKESKRIANGLFHTHKQLMSHSGLLVSTELRPLWFPSNWRLNKKCIHFLKCAFFDDVLIFFEYFGLNFLFFYEMLVPNINEYCFISIQSTLKKGINIFPVLE